VETFSREAAEGVYRVTVEFGCDEADSVTTCKGEARRLFVLGERVPKGGSVAKTFLVDVHRPEFPGGRVALKQREQGSPTWDERLTLEFLGGAAGVRDAVVESLGDFPEAVRRVALEKDVPLIDLNAMSKRLYQALGAEGSKEVFLHVPAGTYPGQDAPIADDTHFSSYGAYEIARCVVEGIRSGVPDLAALLADDVEPFDPEHPDPRHSVAIPESPFEALAVPDGR
jgi:hypothetical protein